MSGRTRYELQSAPLFEIPETPREIFSAPVHEIASRTCEVIEVHPGKSVESRVSVRSSIFFVGELDESLNVPHVTILQEWILEHTHKTGTQGDRYSIRNIFVGELLQNLKKRNVRFRDALIKPILFQKELVFRMSNVRKVRVQHETEITLLCTHLLTI